MSRSRRATPMCSRRCTTTLASTPRWPRTPCWAKTTCGWCRTTTMTSIRPARGARRISGSRSTSASARCGPTPCSRPPACVSGARRRAPMNNAPATSTRISGSASSTCAVTGPGVSPSVTSCCSVRTRAGRMPTTTTRSSGRSTIRPRRAVWWTSRMRMTSTPPVPGWVCMRPGADALPVWSRKWARAATSIAIPTGLNSAP